MLNSLLLSEIGNERLLVCCDKCGSVSNLSVSALIGSYGDLPLNPLKVEIAQRCLRGTDANNECGMYFRNIEPQSCAAECTVMAAAGKKTDVHAAKVNNIPHRARADLCA
jgi:hypothetical protein